VVAYFRGFSKGLEGIEVYSDNGGCGGYEEGYRVVDGLAIVCTIDYCGGTEGGIVGADIL
jgi:hypothetical protein